MPSYHPIYTLAYIMLVFASVSTVFANPIAVKNPSSLEKRNVYCDGRLGGVKYSDCRAAFLQIPTLESTLHFWPYQGARPDEGLPYIWSVGECTIAANLIDPHTEEYLSWLDISDGALSIINRCVSPSRIGGTAAVGTNANFRVIIYQFDYADEDHIKVGPDPKGVCAVKKPETEDLDKCVLHEALVTHFHPAASH